MCTKYELYQLDNIYYQLEIHWKLQPSKIIELHKYTLQIYNKNV